MSGRSVRCAPFEQNLRIRRLREGSHVFHFLHRAQPLRRCTFLLQMKSALQPSCQPVKIRKMPPFPHNVQPRRGWPL